MAWDFSTDPEFEARLSWMRTFVREQIEPLETLELGHDAAMQLTARLKVEVKAQGLWAAHLPPEHGGGGFGQVQLGLMHEILGRSALAPAVFGANGPDPGNSELIAEGGTEEQKERWMRPLLDGKLRSAFSMTEPGAGADPTLLATTAARDGNEWVINGHKWCTSNGSTADFLVVMAVNNPLLEARLGTSMFLVPVHTPGVTIWRDIPTRVEPHLENGPFGGHAEILYDDVRIPFDNIVGGEAGVGQGFALAQKRLGPGRIRHAMRWVGQGQRALRSLSRCTDESALAEKRVIQDWIATSTTELHAARLLTLQAAWKVDQMGPSKSRVEIAMIKSCGAKALYDVIDRAIQVQGSLGYTTELPLESMYRHARGERTCARPDGARGLTIDRQISRGCRASESLSEHLPTRAEAARAKFADLLDTIALND